MKDGRRAMMSLYVMVAISIENIAQGTMYYGVKRRRDDI